MSYRAVDFEVSTLGEISLLNYFIYINTKRMSSASEFENDVLKHLTLFVVYAMRLIRRVKAKSAITLELKRMPIPLK